MLSPSLSHRPQNPAIGTLSRFNFSLRSVRSCALWLVAAKPWSMACLSLILPAFNCFCPFFISPKSRISLSCTSGLVTLRGGNVVFSFYLKYPMPPGRTKHGSGYELLRSNFSLGKWTIPQYDYPLYGGNRRGGLQQYVLSLQMEAYHRQWRTMATDYRFLCSTPKGWVACGALCLYLIPHLYFTI